MPVRREPKAITSGKVGTTNEFRVAFLAAGTYDLVPAQHDANGAFVTVVAQTNGLAVESTKTTAADFTL